jgi:hypothetical protein
VGRLLPHRVTLVTLASVIAFALATSRGAAAEGDVSRARAVFAEGIRRYQAADWEGARRLFLEADREHHAPSITYNLGLAEEKLGHPQAAVDRFETYLAEAGDTGELGPAAASAIAQIKARSTRLRLDTRPTGARLFVDGAPLAERAPTTVLVTAGHHVVVAQHAGGTTEEIVVEARGGGEALTRVLEAAAPRESPPSEPIAKPADAPPPLAAPPTPADLPRPPQVTSRSSPEGVTWGASFAIVPLYMLGVSTPGVDNSGPAASILAGAVGEVGLALTENVEVLARGLVGIGPDAKPSTGYLGGPGFAFRLGSSWWAGASFVGGRIETSSRGARYGTDLVFGAMFEVSLAVLRKPYGEWLVGVQPGVLVTEQRQDNTTFFLPFTLGVRAF